MVIEKQTTKENKMSIMDDNKMKLHIEKRKLEELELDPVKNEKSIIHKKEFIESIESWLEENKYYKNGKLRR